MKCPILTKEKLLQGLDNGLEIRGFRGSNILWGIKKLEGEFNEDGDLELIGSNKEWKEFDNNK